MADTLEFLKGKAREMAAEYKDRNSLFDAMDQMFHGEYVLPGDLEYLDWIVKQVSTDPFDAINAGTKTLSTLDPKITYHPRMMTKANQERAGEIEQMLYWWLMNAGKRRKAGVIPDIVQSTLLYDTVAMRVTHLGYAQRILETHGLGSKVFKHYQRYGPFAIIVDNPRDVYPIETDYGLEAVLAVRTESLAKVQAFWGDRAEGLTRAMKDNNSPFADVTVYDYQDLAQRAVWAVPGSGDVPQRAADRESHTILAPEEHGLDFLPWIFRSGSTNLATSADKRLKPLLYSIYRTDQWLNQNLLNTTVFSEALATAAQPMTQITGATPETAVEEDWDVPGGERLVKAGHQVEEIPRRQLDQALTILGDRIQQAMNRSTGVRILQDADVPSGAAFATLNLATQTAVGNLKPFKRLAEVALADVCEQMLLWVRQSDEPAYAFGGRPSNAGQQLMIEANEIDPAALYIDVELHPDVPTDRQARINGANMLIQQGFPRARAWEELAIADPQQALQEGYQEQMEQAFISQEVQALLAEANARAQARVQQIMMAAQQQMQGPPQQGPPQQQGPPRRPPPQNGQSGPFPGGPGFSPPQGGQPPAVANPSGTREQVSGRDRQGNET